MNLGIIGHGFVGKAVEYGFQGHYKKSAMRCPHKILVYDKYEKSENSTSLLGTVNCSDILFICLPTPFDDMAMTMDLSVCENVLAEMAPMIARKDKIVVIKSTVTPGTTVKWAAQYPDIIFVFNPEFLTEANANLDFVNTDRIVLGVRGTKPAGRMTALYRSCPWFEHTPICMTTLTGAEIVKYHSNITLAIKVSVANVIYDMCVAQGVEYESVQTIVGLDKRIGPSHLGVTEERGWGGKCFPKDLGAFIGHCRSVGVDAKLLEELFAYNLRIRKTHDWFEIPGATTQGAKYKER